jgi:peptidoglycan/LPS O-acetylase OafA/YrhL
MKRADIQGMRAVAVIFVLLFHFETRIKGGYLGVDMFFVISGFVIASSTLREIDSTNAFSWRSFLHRRVRRLLPGTALVAIATAVLSMVLLSPFGPQKETAKMLLGAATDTSNFLLMPQSYFSLDPKANPLLHMWSLAVEEQFYFVWPMAIMVFVSLRKIIHQQVFKVVVWTVLSATLLASCWLFFLSATRGSQVKTFGWFRPFIQGSISPEHFSFYSPFTRAWEFLAGVVVALLLRRRMELLLLKAGSLITCCGAALVILGVAWASKYPEVQHEAAWSTNTSATLVVVIGTAVWIFGGSNDKVIHPLISLKPLSSIGDYSYSIYLLHWPIWVFLITSFRQSNTLIAVSFVLSLGLGWLQFRFVEEPIRSARRLPSFKSVQFVSVFGLFALIGFSIMSFATPRIALYLTGLKPNQFALHITEKPCSGELFQLRSAQSCVYSTVNEQGIAILVGDSMAKSLSDGFVQATSSQRLNSYVFSLPGCSFLLADSPFAETNPCAFWRADVFSALQQLQPRVLVIANLNSLYVDPPLPDWSVEDTQQIWGSELKRTIEALYSLPTQIVLAQPPPEFAFDLRYDLSLMNSNSVIEDREVVISRRQKMNEVERGALSGFDNIQSILDFSDQFCNEKTCNPRVGNKLLFEDSNHLSVEGSKLVFPELERAISEVLLE